MPIQQDFLSYQKSISQLLKTSENRIRDLIGSSHWLTNGEHKESILRKVISEFAPETYRIGTGFVCYPGVINDERKNSGQIDILITSKETPTLYKSGELHFVTPECVHAIVEVKSKLANGQKLERDLKKLSTEVKEIREAKGDHLNCWAGLFIYEKKNISSRDILEALQIVTNGDPDGAINCIAIGVDNFVRFWRNGHSQSNLGQDAVWHSYLLEGLSLSYFISNLVLYLSPGYSDRSSESWFPIEGTKERHRVLYAKVSETEVHEF